MLALNYLFFTQKQGWPEVLWRYARGVFTRQNGMESFGEEILYDLLLCLHNPVFSLSLFFYLQKFYMTFFATFYQKFGLIYTEMSHVYKGTAFFKIFIENDLRFKVKTKTCSIVLL